MIEKRLTLFKITKAFDRIWHKALLYKLETVGISF